MKEKFEYTVMAQRYTARFPVLTYVLIQINFWIVANILLVAIIDLQFRIFGQAFSIPLAEKSGPVILIAVMLGVLYGLILGLAGHYLEKNFFRKQSLGKVIVIKALGSLAVLTLLVALIRFSLFDLFISPSMYVQGITLNELSWRYTYHALLIYYFFMTLVISFINQVNKKYGPGVLLPLLLGKYRTPKEEERIFMFMDLKSSTAIAEQLGHLKYSSFIRDCFFDINELLFPHRAQVYQYAGDEIILTWAEKEGLKNSYCIRFYFATVEQFHKRSDYYLANYGMVPNFKAGVHSGQVTAVEIGEVKREIAYHGDTLNVASRIQSVCNEFNKSFLSSEFLFGKIQSNQDFLDGSFSAEALGKILLKGKTEKVGIVSIEKSEQAKP
ncbi:adenylate/guanylate cyclase domain-containing protein [Flavitalea sp.]|nr:adenylate/guanylate cyclase domain-containing protein [Flavitalea sp.]